MTIHDCPDCFENLKIFADCHSQTFNVIEVFAIPTIYWTCWRNTFLKLENEYLQTKDSTSDGIRLPFCLTASLSLSMCVQLSEANFALSFANIYLLHRKFWLFFLFALLYNFVTHILWRQTLVFLQCHILSKNAISEGNLRRWVQHSKLMLAHSIQRNFVGHSIAALTDSDPSPTPSFTQPGHLSPSTSCIPLSNISLIYPHWLFSLPKKIFRHQPPYSICVKWVPFPNSEWGVLVRVDPPRLHSSVKH